MARRKPHQLSGGQQQRVAVARALINHPKVLLLDEPLGALDLKLRRQMQLELKRIQTEVGITFIHVTHDQEEAMTMADTVAVMNAGRVEQLGAPADLYENPQHHLRRQLPRHLQPHRGRGHRAPAATTWSSAAGGGKLRLPAGAVFGAHDRTGGKVLVGVRPEKISLAHADDADAIADGRNRITGRIVDSSFIGVSTQYVIDSPVCPEFEVYEQNVDRDARLVPGAEVVLHWNPAHTFGLDAAQDIDAGVGDGGGRDVTVTDAPPAPPEAPPPRPGRAQEPPAAQAPRPVLAAAARHPLAAGLLRAADGLPGVDLRADRLPGGGLQGHLALPTYWDALAEYWPQFLRSVLYAGTATSCACCSATRWRISSPSGRAAGATWC